MEVGPSGRPAENSSYFYYGAFPSHCKPPLFSFSLFTFPLIRVIIRDNQEGDRR